MSDVKYKVGKCLKCQCTHVMSVVGRNQGPRPTCPVCKSGRIVPVKIIRLEDKIVQVGGSVTKVHSQQK